MRTWDEGATYAIAARHAGHRNLGLERRELRESPEGCCARSRGDKSAERVGSSYNCRGRCTASDPVDQRRRKRVSGADRINHPDLRSARPGEDAIQEQARPRPTGGYGNAT